MVDRNLFLHDLAVVAILKNEGAYLKEWLDYHLLAGVDHFYLYDNDSPDNQREVAKPYVEAGLVDYFSAPGKGMQYAVYNDAVKRFKFHCRYMAFIDGDEFIYPKTNQSIAETVDEVLSHDEHAAGLVINWHTFGSNNYETADYSCGVLERFNRRAPNDWAPAGKFNDNDIKLGNAHVKTIADPRRIKFINNPHYLNFVDNFYAVNENIEHVPYWCNFPVTADKIVINHYYTKSREEYRAKHTRGYAASYAQDPHYTDKRFEVHDRNEVFDDGILTYRAARAKNFSLQSDAERFNLVTAALTKTLSAYSSGKIFSMETALTCRALSAYLREKVPSERWNIYEEASLGALLQSTSNMSFAEARLFLRELPKLLKLPYPVVDELRAATLQIIPQMMKTLRINSMLEEYVELDYLQDILKLGG